MKKAILICLLIVLVSMFIVSGGMAMTLYGGVQYEIADGYGKLSLYYMGPGGVVTLRTQVGETPITVVGGYCFIMNASNVTELTIPNGYTTVEDYAFHLSTPLLQVEIADSVTYLGQYVFDYCINLAEVELPSTLTELNNGLFNGCRSLGNVQIPVGVTRIGDSVFSGCSSLNDLTIPQGVTSVGASAFQGCSNLTAIHLPDGVTEIKALTFYNCGALRDVSFSDALTAIGDSAFEKCASLAELTIPNTVTSIGSKAFSGCTSLGSITIPNGVQFVGEKAFDNCPAQRYAAIGSDGAKALGKAGYTFRTAGLAYDLRYVYDGDTLLGLEILNVPKDVTAFSLPSFVTRIGKDAFRNCAGLAQISLHGSLNYIGANAFSGCESLAGVTVPSSVTEIANNAFSSCPAQRIASVGTNGAKALGKAGYSFHDSQIDADMQYVYANNECTEFRLLSVNKAFTSFTVPAGVTTISASAFENCVDLTEVILPATMTSIGNNAFKHCDSLPAIDIPENVASVSGSAFSYCPAQRFAGLNTNGARALSKAGYTFRVKGDPFELKYLFTDGEVSGLSILNVNKDITDFQIPDWVTAIGDSAFKDCADLAEVTIPASVNSIDSHAFENCGNLIRVSIPEGVTAIKAYTFNNSSSLQEVSLPSTLTSVEQYAFRNTALPAINIPNGVTNVHGNAFLSSSTVKYADRGSEGARALSKAGYTFRVKGDPFELKYLFTDGEVSGLSILNVNKDITVFQIPDWVTAIGDSAFKDCADLAEVTIPASVNSIDSHAFENCGNLIQVSIPEGVTAIKAYTFNNCSSLQEASLPSTLTSVEQYAFRNTALPAIDIPNGVTNVHGNAFLSSSTVKYADRGSEGARALSKAGYSFRVKGDPFELKYLFTDGVVSGLSLLNADKDIASLQIPADITEIGNSAFKNCAALTAVSIPDSVTSIGSYAFQYCSALNRLLIPGNVTNIASNAFVNRSSAFTLLVVENSAAHTYAVNQSIPYNLLSFESLNTLYLPQGVKTIEAEAFMNLGCEAVVIPAGCETIEERAFAGCVYLIYVQLPSSVVSVEDNAFEGCGQIIFVEP